MDITSLNLSKLPQTIKIAEEVSYGGSRIKVCPCVAMKCELVEIEVPQAHMERKRQTAKAYNVTVQDFPGYQFALVVWDDRCFCLTELSTGFLIGGYDEAPRHVLILAMRDLWIHRSRFESVVASTRQKLEAKKRKSANRKAKSKTVG